MRSYVGYRDCWSGQPSAELPTRATRLGYSAYKGGKVRVRIMYKPTRSVNNYMKHARLGGCSLKFALHIGVEQGFSDIRLGVCWSNAVGQQRPGGASEQLKLTGTVVMHLVEGLVGLVDTARPA